MNKLFISQNVTSNPYQYVVLSSGNSNFENYYGTIQISDSEGNPLSDVAKSDIEVSARIWYGKGEQGILSTDIQLSLAKGANKANGTPLIPTDGEPILSLGYTNVELIEGKVTDLIFTTYVAADEHYGNIKLTNSNFSVSSRIDSLKMTSTSTSDTISTAVLTTGSSYIEIDCNLLAGYNAWENHFNKYLSSDTTIEITVNGQIYTGILTTSQKNTIKEDSAVSVQMSIK